MNIRHFVCVLVISLALVACSSEPKKEDVKFGKIEVVPSAVEKPLNFAPAKDQGKAKLPENVRKLIEREDALAAKGRAKPNASDKEIFGSSTARPAAPKW